MDFAEDDDEEDEDEPFLSLVILWPFLAQSSPKVVRSFPPGKAYKSRTKVCSDIALFAGKRRCETWTSVMAHVMYVLQKRHMLCQQSTP